MSEVVNNSVLIPTLRPHSAPAWSSQIDRWSQLDETCFTFCEALHTWNYLAELTKPDLIFLVLPQASNEADMDFVRSGALSPAKFVFTLPNICASVLLQMIDFSGPTFCISKGADSLRFAHNEALELSNKDKISWIFANTVLPAEKARSVEFFSYSKASYLK